MWGYHLKRRGRWWHYFRSVPERYRDVETRKEVCFSLRTQDFSEAKLKAARVSADLDHEWQRALELGVSLESQSAAKRYAAAVQSQTSFGLKPAVAAELSDEDLMTRLRILVSGKSSVPDQKAVLGLIDKPNLSMMDAFDRFWSHIVNRPGFTGE